MTTTALTPGRHHCPRQPPSPPSQASTTALADHLGEDLDY
jgi:hypothetical protein